MSQKSLPRNERSFVSLVLIFLALVLGGLVLVLRRRSV